jgi:hypothetical protein
MADEKKWQIEWSAGGYILTENGRDFLVLCNGANEATCQRIATLLNLAEGKTNEELEALLRIEPKEYRINVGTKPVPGYEQRDLTGLELKGGDTVHITARDVDCGEA